MLLSKACTNWMPVLIQEYLCRFLYFWLLVFENLYGCIWASYPSHKMCMKEENNSKESVDDQKRILSALKFVAEIIISKNRKRNQGSGGSLLSVFLSCTKVWYTYFAVIQTKTLTSLVSTWPKSVFKRCRSLSKIVFLDVKTAFRCLFLLSKLQCLPLGLS